MTQRSDAPGVELGYIAEGLRGLAERSGDGPERLEREVVA